MNTPNHRENNFDALRIVAAMAVIYGHARPLGGVPDIGFFGNSIQALAVKIFFVISGYLVAKSWVADPSPFRYLAKRGLRIFPGLLLLLLLTVLILGPLLTTLPLDKYFSNSNTWRYLFYNLILYPIYSLPGVFENNVYPNAVNGSLWSLPVEFLMYLVFPLVYVCSRLDRTNRLLVAFTICLCVSSLYLLRGGGELRHMVFHGTALSPVLDVAPYFFLGSIVGVTRVGSILDPGIALFLAVVAALLQPIGAVSTELLLYVIVPYCVLSLATIASPVIYRAGRWGDPSYGIYLYGFVVQQTVYHFGAPGMSPFTNTFISIPIAVVLAYASWHFVEKRALRLKPRGGSR
ncbi:acyltransferase family protein [Pseudoxanthomonas koreensis]|uniref:acyltransferase family protein n=1 Tax=Pseudoxanthomonas koreensis TaxID=266061 RepID=UPI001391A323|nr:acyltransferase [Pseudoxanthomonas koreensis]KAF1691586.1 acyltransferase [Pseudoxanthomonas koreensis]